MSTFLPISDRNLILTGYTGPDLVGLGRQVADRLRKPYVNLDVLIAERADLQIDDIRSYLGEPRLKSFQAEIIAEAALRRDSVIRVSGRILQQKELLQRLLATGPVICVVVSLDLVLHRLHVNMGARYHDPQERATVLSELEREWAVRGQPDVYELDLTKLDVATSVEKIAETWQVLVMAQD